jgi:hypothetical protein
MGIHHVAACNRHESLGSRRQPLRDLNGSTVRLFQHSDLLRIFAMDS